MTNKNELIAKLDEMGKVLDREMDTSGTVAELELRIREAQEEIDQSNEDNGYQLDGTGNVTFAGDPDTSPALSDEKSKLVKVCLLKTLHIAGAWHETNNEPVTMAIANKVIRIPQELADELIAAGQAAEVIDE